MSRYLLTYLSGNSINTVGTEKKRCEIYSELEHVSNAYHSASLIGYEIISCIGYNTGDNEPFDLLEELKLKYKT